MLNFQLINSDEYYLCLSDEPKRFDADSPATNVFFDDTNGQVFTVRSGGVTGVTVSSMDEKKCTTFRMEDRGPIISIKLSPDQNILAIQRNQDNQNATVEFVNFKDLAPTNVEYSHTCKWKNAKILGFVWPKVNEIAFITDHGIELLQVLPEKKQLKSLKNTSFSGAWFSWCAQSNIVLLAGNNGALLQPFSFSNSTITKLQKLELETGKPVVERDVFVLRVCEATWCAVFRHGTAAGIAAPGPTEVWLMPISGTSNQQFPHILKTGLSGRFAVSIVDDLVVVHHQSSQSSLVFDPQEACACGAGGAHGPALPPASVRPARVGGQACPMYSGTWVVFQPDYIIDARLGCLWQVKLLPGGLAHSVPKEDIAKIVSVLLRRTDGKDAVYRILNQLVAEAGTYLAELSAVFDEINSVYRSWAEQEMCRNTAGAGSPRAAAGARLVLPQEHVCSRVLQPAEGGAHIVQVVTAYLASLTRHDITIAQCTAELCVRALHTRGAHARLRALARRGALGDSRPLACALLSLGHLHPAAGQLALDMMTRLNAHQEIMEVVLSWEQPVVAAGAARQAGGAAWAGAAPRKLLAAARGAPRAFLAVMHALRARNERARGAPHFLKGEQCDSFLEYYKQLTEQ